MKHLFENKEEKEMTQEPWDDLKDGTAVEIFNQVNARLEKLLNRAGQTIADLPKGNDDADVYPIDRASYASTLAVTNGFSEAEYICHLADIIDRMETALMNTLVKLEEAQRGDRA